MTLTRALSNATSGLSNAGCFNAPNAYNTLNSEIGLPGSGYGLFSTLENLEAGFTSLQANPESTALQNGAVSAAIEVTQELNSLSHLALSLRETADNNISNSVETVNNALTRIKDLNREISVSEGLNGAPALKDERQALMNTISEIIPIKEVARENGKTDIVTDSGVLLLSANGIQNELSFTATPVITNAMRYGEAGSPLSGLFVGEQNLTSAEFEIRDSIATEFTDNLDSIAADLVDRLSNDNIDSTKTPGAQGLFTDSTLAIDPTEISGAASRIRVNNAVNPNVGGEVYRIRDGLGATTTGNVGNTEIITNMLGALTENRTAPGGSFISGDHNIVSAAAALTSIIGEQSLRYDSINASTTARRDVLQDAELELSGVDTDKELQDLLLIEQAYSANARVIQTVSDMLDTLLQL